MLELESVETAYGAKQVLFGVSLMVRKGEVVTLLGRKSAFWMRASDISRRTVLPGAASASSPKAGRFSPT